MTPILAFALVNLTASFPATGQLDGFQMGEVREEQFHNFASWRSDGQTPFDGGWIEFDMNVDPVKPVDLVLTYLGNERVRPSFDILANGVKFAAETLSGKPSNRFFDVRYGIPEAVTLGRTSVTIRIQALEHKVGGSVLGAQTVFRR